MGSVARALAGEPAPTDEAERTCHAQLERLHDGTNPSWPTQYEPDIEPIHKAAGIDAMRFRGSLAGSATTAIVYRLDLSRGARVALTGGLDLSDDDTRHASAAYDTGRDPHLPPRPLDRHWEAVSAAFGDRAFAAINGQFFGATPVRLAFPLKADGVIVSGGYAGRDEYDGEKLMLAIDGDRATILPFPEVGYPENPLFSEVPDAIVGLHPCAEKGRDRAVGRTFAGVADRDADGHPETLLFLTASHASQRDAIAILGRFGALATVMLDGGGSTQSIALGRTLLTSSDATARPIPHAIGLLSAPPVTP
ncbi:MAG: phosphodiester glycosidase family protein [Geitlerinemataceae cyanobacterium]